MLWGLTHRFDGGNVLKKTVRSTIGILLVLFFSASLHAQYGGEGRWDRLGDAHVDGGQDHDNIHVGRHDGRFRAIQLRVSGGAIYFERVVVHFGDGSHEELIIRDKIPSGGQTRAIDLPGERRVIESVELWYGKDRWSHRPKVTLYGVR
jgi:hypothetical protein